MKKLLCLTVALFTIFSSLSINCYASYFKSKNYFAVINGETVEEFDNFKDAYNAIDIYDFGDKGTIKLLRDAEIYEYCGINGVNLTLDLAGHKLSFYDEGELCVLKYWSGLNIISSEGIGVIEGAHLQNGRLTIGENVKMLNSCIAANGGFVKIYDGVFENTTIYFGSKVEVYGGYFSGGTAFSLNDGAELIINDGTFVSSGDTFKYGFYCDKDTCTITLAGGEFPNGIKLPGYVMSEGSHNLSDILGLGYSFCDSNGNVLKLIYGQKELKGYVSVKKIKSVLSVENSSFQTDYYYTGKAVPAPGVDNFVFVCDDGQTASLSSDNIKFTWLKNGEPLNDAPIDIGNYILRIEFQGNDKYTDAAKELEINIKYPDFDCGTDFVTENKNADWYSVGYVSNPKVEEYLVGFSEENFVSAANLKADFIIDGNLTYFVKEISTGYIKKITVSDSELRVDPISPEIVDMSVSDINASSAVVTVNASDTGSGISRYELISSDNNVVITNSGNGVFEITGLTPGTEYAFGCAVSDYAGNRTENETILVFTTAKEDVLSISEVFKMIYANFLSRVNIALWRIFTPIFMFIISLI